MRSDDEHRWTKSDDLVAFYLFREGDGKLGIALPEVATQLGIYPETMKMRLANFKSLQGPGGLNHPAKQSQAVYEEYCNVDEPILRGIVLGILLRARSVLDNRPRINERSSGEHFHEIGNFLAVSL